MNGPQLDAAILFSKATTQLDDSESEVTHKYIYTLALITASLNTGMNDGLVAPTMVDLELVTGGSPESVSVMFALRALFVVLGSVISGKIIQKNPHKRPVLIGTALILESLFGTIIPWLPTTEMVDLASGVSALFTGTIIVGTYSSIYSIWKRSAIGPVRALRLSYTFGIGMASLIALPFIWQRSSENRLLYSSLLQDTGHHCSLPTNLGINSTVRREDEKLSHVQAAYFVVALTGFLLSMVFFCLPVTRSERNDTVKSLQRDQNESKVFRSIFNLESSISSSLTIAIYISFMAFTTAFGGSEITFTGLLISYCYDFLGWGKKEAIIMSAFYQMVKLVFAIFAIFLSLKVPLCLILFGNIVIVTSTSVILLDTISCGSRTSMWICTLCLAVGNSGLFPCCLAWVGQKRKLWRKLPALFNISFCCGVIILPYLTAHLLVTYGYTYLPWVLVVCGAIGSCMFLVLLTLLEFLPYIRGVRDETQPLLERDPEHPAMWAL